MNREAIQKYFPQLKLRALRISKGLTLEDIAERLKMSKAQIIGWELGNKLRGYRNKQLIFQAYDIQPDDIKPTEEEINRVEQLMANFTVEEIQMAYDMQSAAERSERYRRGREKHKV